MNKSLHTVTALAGLLSLGVASAAAQVFLVDFGSTTTDTTGWNNVTGASGVSVSFDLVDSTGAASNVSLIVAASPNSFTNVGTTSATSTGFGAFPSTAVSDFLASNNVTTILTITGLDPTKTYTFEFFASRATGAGTRGTVYTLTNDGLTSAASSFLEAADNVSNTASISAFAPSAGGQIVLTLTRGAENTSGFTYLNAMTITVETSQVPEPSSFAALAGVGAIGFVALRRRRR